MAHWYWECAIAAFLSFQDKNIYSFMADNFALLLWAVEPNGLLFPLPTNGIVMNGIL
jgi:hypothetical protein